LFFAAENHGLIEMFRSLTYSPFLSGPNSMH